MTCKTDVPSCLISRREFLFASAAAVAAVTLPISGIGTVHAQVGSHPHKRIARLGDLKPHEPLYFNYPDTASNANNMLVKLGRPAGYGIGPDKDVVAFSLTCTHMGGNLTGTYKPDNASLGPCPLHLSSFDLTRHGLMVTGNATQSLPQILLELDGDDVIAHGVLGLLFGYDTNPV